MKTEFHLQVQILNGKNNPMLTELNYYGEEAAAQQVADDWRRAERRAAVKRVETLTWQRDDAECRPRPEGVKCFRLFDSSRSQFGIEGKDALWLRVWNAADGDDWNACNDGDFIAYRFPYDAEVANAIQLLALHRGYRDFT